MDGVLLEKGVAAPASSVSLEELEAQITEFAVTSMPPTIAGSR